MGCLMIHKEVTEGSSALPPHHVVFFTSIQRQCRPRGASLGVGIQEHAHLEQEGIEAYAIVVIAISLIESVVVWEGV
jgi:hypothetical protein